MEKLNLQIAHLYAHFLNIYGDRGNIIALSKRANWRGIEVNVEAIGLGQEIDADRFDIYFVGGGQDKQQQTIASDLIRHADTLKKAVEGGAVVLSVCGGYQLLGHYYRMMDNAELKGVSLINAYTIASNQRMIGNVVVRRENQQTLVGFENHSGKTYLENGTNALGKVTTGFGNNGEDGYEGVDQSLGKGKIYGTYLHGSLLPKNSSFTDELIEFALRRKYGQIPLASLNDSLENSAHEYALGLQAQ